MTLYLDQPSEIIMWDSDGSLTLWFWNGVQPPLLAIHGHSNHTWAFEIKKHKNMGSCFWFFQNHTWSLGGPMYKSYSPPTTTTTTTRVTSIPAAAGKKKHSIRYKLFSMNATLIPNVCKFNTSKTRWNFNTSRGKKTNTILCPKQILFSFVRIPLKCDYFCYFSNKSLQTNWLQYEYSAKSLHSLVCGRGGVPYGEREGGLSYGEAGDVEGEDVAVGACQHGGLKLFGGDAGYPKRQQICNFYSLGVFCVWNKVLKVEIRQRLVPFCW